MHDDATPSAEYLKLQAILANAVDGIITIDERGTIESVNPATTALFQYQEAELVGKNVDMLMPAPFKEQHDDYLRAYLQTRIAKIIGVGREVVGRRKDGTVFPIHLAVSEVNTENRRLFTGIVRDISDLKEAERRLSKLNDQLEERVKQRTAELQAAQAELVRKEKLATLGQLSGGIAHEIRNPLNAVKASAYYLLNAENASDDKRTEHLVRIDRQVTVIDNVITALSDVAKLPEPKLAPVSVHSVLTEVIQQVALHNSITTKVTIDESHFAMSDGSQIPMVFRNLVRNARDAMPNGGRLEISSACNGTEVAVQLTDNGCGIPVEALDRVWEPLYTTKARGMGLGLAICKVITERNGGSIEVASEAGKGSTFTVRLQTAKP